MPTQKADAGDQTLAEIETVLNQDPDAENKEHDQHYGEETADHRAGHRQDDGDHLWQERGE